MYVYMCAYIYMYIHTYIYIYIREQARDRARCTQLISVAFYRSLTLTTATCPSSAAVKRQLAPCWSVSINSSRPACACGYVSAKDGM